LSSGIFEACRDILALFSIGLAIKLMDDHLDREEADGARLPLAARLGRGVCAYTVLSYALAAWLKPSWAWTLFLASYACGMLGSGAWRLPSGLPGWLETVLAFALGVTAAGWREMASSTAFVMGVQLWDDVVDFARDRYLTRANLAQRWGRVEAALAGTALLFIALFLAAAKTLLGLLVLPWVLYVAAAPWGKERG